MGQSVRPLVSYQRSRLLTLSKPWSRHCEERSRRSNPGASTVLAALDRHAAKAFAPAKAGGRLAMTAKFLGFWYHADLFEHLARAWT
jgi:hypothetical protein